MRTRTASSLVTLAAVVAAAPAAARAQILSVSPTYQQSVASFESRVADPLRGESLFSAWGVMLGLERPGRFWQPHVWYQRFDFDGSCPGAPTAGECGNDGWALSAGPGLQIVETPRITGMLLTQIGMQSRGTRGLTGGAGFHVGVRLGMIQPTAFGQYQMIRGAHYATVGAGLVFRFGSGPSRPGRGASGPGWPGR